MANLGLLGALAGAGQALSNFGADIVRRREEALKWAEEEAKYQRERADKLTDTKSLYAHEDTLAANREAGADRRNTADNEAADARVAAQHENRMAEIGAEQKGQKEIHQIDAQATLEREKVIEQLRATNETANIKLRNQVEADDVQGVKYGERYSVNPKSGRPYSDPNSPYTELILVKKDGSIVHTGKLILAPQNRSGQDGEDNPY